MGLINRMGAHTSRFIDSILFSIFPLQYTKLFLSSYKVGVTKSLSLPTFCFYFNIGFSNIFVSFFLISYDFLKIALKLIFSTNLNFALVVCCYILKLLGLR